MLLRLNTTDPHAVYYRIFPKTDLPSDAIYIRRGLVMVTSNFFIIRVFLVLFGDFLAAIKCCFSSGRNVIVIEFSTYSALVYLLPLSYVFNWDSLLLNINHNLNGKLSRFIIRNILSSRLKFCFIEPSVEMIKEYPFLKAVRLRPARSGSVKHNSLYCFLPKRKEQCFADEVDYIDAVKEISCCIKTVFVGKDSVLDQTEFARLFLGRSVIVILYKADSYSERHSGIALEAIVNGCTLLMPRTSLSLHYENSGFSVTTFLTPDDLKKKLLWLLNEG